MKYLTSVLLIVGLGFLVYSGFSLVMWAFYVGMAIVVLVVLSELGWHN